MGKEIETGVPQLRGGLYMLPSGRTAALRKVVQAADGRAEAQFVYRANGRDEAAPDGMAETVAIAQPNWPHLMRVGR